MCVCVFSNYLSESCGLRRLESSSYWGGTLFDKLLVEEGEEITWEEESEEGKRRRWSIGGLAGASLVVPGCAAGEEEDGAGHGPGNPAGGREGSCAGFCSGVFLRLTSPKYAQVVEVKGEVKDMYLPVQSRFVERHFGPLAQALD